jgi:hypothetical protein
LLGGGAVAATASGFPGGELEQIRSALRLTGRLSFLVFLAALIARRDDGNRRLTAFAGIHSPHAFLIVWFAIRGGGPFPSHTIAIGGAGLLLMYTAAFTRSEIVRHATLQVLAVIFAYDFIGGTLTRSPIAYYAPFALALIAGYGVWLYYRVATFRGRGNRATLTARRQHDANQVGNRRSVLSRARRRLRSIRRRRTRAT